MGCYTPPFTPSKKDISPLHSRPLGLVDHYFNHIVLWWSIQSARVAVNAADAPAEPRGHANTDPVFEYRSLAMFNGLWSGSILNGVMSAWGAGVFFFHYLQQKEAVFYFFCRTASFLSSLSLNAEGFRYLLIKLFRWKIPILQVASKCIPFDWNSTYTDNMAAQCYCFCSMGGFNHKKFQNFIWNFLFETIVSNYCLCQRGVKMFHVIRTRLRANEGRHCAVLSPSFVHWSERQ